jgi:hypothetical protein
MLNVKGLGNKELKELGKAVGAERARRLAHKVKIEEQRENWISSRFLHYLMHPNATSIVRGKSTFVAIYDRNYGHRIVEAICAPGDHFEERVGIAVAMAKYNGEEIPDFI